MTEQSTNRKLSTWVLIADKQSSQKHFIRDMARCPFVLPCFASGRCQEDASRYSALLGPTPLTTGPAGTPQELEDAEKVGQK